MQNGGEVGKQDIYSKENMLAGIEHHRVKVRLILVGIWIKGKFLAAFAPHPPFPRSLGLLLGPVYMEAEDPR